MRVCLVDGEPLVFTFEFPGAEWYCVVCGGKEDIFGQRVPSTTELQLRLDELTEQYDRARAGRMGVDYEPRAKVGEPGVKVPSCNACGAMPADGIALDRSGKPSSWFSRTRGDVTLFACSRACIPSDESVLPW